MGALDTLLVPLGSGGLLSGCATVARALSPACRVIGVEPESGNDGQRSFRSGQIVHIETPKTIADGAQTQHLGHHTFPVIRRSVDDILTVSDAELVEAMKFFASRMKMIVEPTGCLAAALAFSGQLDLGGQRVGVLLSGGNVDLARFAVLVQEPAVQGRAAVSELQLIFAEALGQPGGHYSHAACAGGLVFISGQLPITARGQRLSDEPFEVGCSGC